MRHYSEKLHSALPMASKGVIVVFLGALLGFAVVNFSTQALVMIGTGLLLFAFLIQPAKFLLGYLIALPILDQLVPFFTVRSSGFRLGPQIILRGGITMLLVFYWLVNQRNPFAFKFALPAFLLIVLLVITTFIGGILVLQGIGEIAKIAFWTFLALVVADMVLQGKMELKTVYRCIVLSLMVFEVSLLIVEYFPVTGTAHFRANVYGIGEFSGLFAGHNVARALPMGFPVVLITAVRTRNRLSNLLLLLFSVLIIISIMRTYVRTGYVTLISGLLMLGLMLRHYREEASRRESLVLGAAFILAIGAIAIYTLMHIDAFGERFIDFGGSGRNNLWGSAIKSYADYPISMKLFGGGYGRASTFYLDYTLGTHNGYLFFLLSGGVIGLCLYLWLFVSIWWQIRPTRQNEHLPLILASTAIVMYLVAEMLSGIYPVTSATTYFGFLVGGAIGYYRRTEEADCLFSQH